MDRNYNALIGKTKKKITKIIKDQFNDRIQIHGSFFWRKKILEEKIFWGDVAVQISLIIKKLL